MAYRELRPQLIDSKYTMLERRPEKSQQVIPYIKGHNVRADHLWDPIYEKKVTPEFIANDMCLPLEGVKQAITWCEENQDLVKLVTDEELMRCGLA